MLCFSTCWNSSRHTDGYKVIKELVDMGIDKIELSHGIPLTLIPGIQKALQEKLVKVVGIHNFCPSPVEILVDNPDAYVFTSHRADERARAMRLTKESIRFGEKVGAGYIVLHMGFLPMKKISRDLRDLAKDDKIDTNIYLQNKIKLLRKRKKTAPIYFRRAIDALEELVEVAEKAKIRLAVESRSSFEEMPNDEEMLFLMEKFSDCPWVGYWHDFGHVHRKHNLGLLDHELWLKAMLPFLVGCHVHDVIWPHRDHHVPFSGDIDLRRLVKLVPADTPLVWELSKRRKKDIILEALKVWRKVLPDRT